MSTTALRTGLLLAALAAGGACSSRPPAEAAAATEGEIPAARGIALLPLQGLVVEVEELRRATATLREAFENSPLRTLPLIPAGEVERVLAARRIRVVDTLTPQAAAAISRDLGGARLLTGTYAYATDQPEPTAALMLRCFDADGTRLGSRLWLRRGNQDQDLFGLNGSTALAEMLARNAAAIADAALARMERRPAPGRPRVAIFPFESNWDTPESGMLTSLVAAHLLEEEFGLEVIEPRDLGEAFLAARIRYLRLAGVQDVQQLGRAAGVPWLVTGAVLEFDYGGGEAGVARASLIVRLFDVERGRTVASALGLHAGDEGEIVFGAGLAAHPIDNLAHALREGIQELEPTWQGS